MPATPSWPPRSAPRLFVDEVLAEQATIRVDGNRAHYLGRVMRVVPGDAVVLCDDVTGEWAAQVETVEKRTVTLRATEKLRDREPVPDFWLCPALLKRDRFDVTLEKATELGVAEIRPVLTRRCVADKLNGERAAMLTTEAAEQCARTALPVVARPVPLAQLIQHWPSGRHLFFADENGGKSALSAFAENPGPAALLIGPEGGFDPEERDKIRSHSAAVPISLGPRILRAETAAIAATAIWMAVAGDWAIGVE